MTRSVYAIARDLLAPESEGIMSPSDRYILHLALGAVTYRSLPDGANQRLHAIVAELVNKYDQSARDLLDRAGMVVP